MNDFIVLLPKFAGEMIGEYTMVTKEWAPDMLDGYTYSEVGINIMNVKTKLEEGWI